MFKCNKQSAIYGQFKSYKLKLAQTITIVEYDDIENVLLIMV